MKRLGVLFLMIFAAAVAASAQGLAVGGKMENFSLADTNGKAQTLTDVKGTKGVVIIFVSSQCPVVCGYTERLNKLVTDYKAKGINVVGINANVTETPGEIKMHGDATYKFPVLIDKNSTLFDKLGARN